MHESEIFGRLLKYIWEIIYIYQVVLSKLYIKFGVYLKVTLLVKMMLVAIIDKSPSLGELP